MIGLENYPYMNQNSLVKVLTNPFKCIIMKYKLMEMKEIGNLENFFNVIE